MTGVLTLLVVVGATFALFATTRAGDRLVRWIGLGRFLPGAASSEDVAYLIRTCGGDRREARERIAVERARYPDLSEAELYRRAIRRVFNERGSRD